MKTVEDYLNFLIENNLSIHSSDVNLLQSLYRQIQRGIGFTDRQLALTVSKIEMYKDQFNQADFIFCDEELKNVKLPLRKIDRSKTIKFVEENDEIFLAIRFPFSKKMIKYIDEIQSLQKGKRNYDKQTKTHFLPANEKNIYQIVSKLKDVNFTIDSDVFNLYERINEMENNKPDFEPGIYSFKLKNLHDKTFEYAISSIGEPSPDNLHIFKDRSNNLGLSHFDQNKLDDSIKNLQPLTKKIIFRKNSEIYIDRKLYNLKDVIASLLELYRFPLAVILPVKNTLRHLKEMTDNFNNIVDTEDCFVSFRKDNNKEEDIQFNQYIKQNNFANSLDKATKIVYISIDKLPKPVISSGWQPNCALYLESAHATQHVRTYTSELDLVVHFDDTMSVMRRNIEKI